MKRMSYYLALAVLITMSTSYAGNSSGGGGGVLFGKNGPVLVDLLNIDPNFKDSISHKNLNASRISNKSVIRMNSANEADVRKDNAAFDLALQIIQKWQDKYFGVSASNIGIALNAPVEWNFIYKTLKAPDSYLPLANIDRDQIRIAAYYEMKNRDYSVKVSIPVWNQLGIFTQSGLLIHEGLRHLQIGWSNNFDEKTLQYATAILMMCEPDVSLNQYLFYMIQNRPDLGDQLIGDFNTVIKKYCKRAK